MFKKRFLTKSILCRLALATCMILGGPAAAYGAGSVEWPAPAPSSSYGMAISADGKVVVGQFLDASGDNFPFRWTQAGGFAPLNTAPAKGSAWGVNGDGSVIVGYIDGYRGVRWTASGTEVLVPLPGDVVSKANGVSGAGNVVVGESASIAGVKAVTWVLNPAAASMGAANELGSLKSNPASGTSSAFGISYDGRVVVGDADTDSSDTRAVRWLINSGGGTVHRLDLGSLRTDGKGYSGAYAVNRDGSIIAGESRIDSGDTRAVRWVVDAANKITDKKDLGTLGGAAGDYSSARGINGDGSVVVGVSNDPGKSTAFRWTEATGMVSVADWLKANGVSGTNSLNLEEAKGVSADGNAIVGNGMFNGSTQAFIARVTPAGGNSGIIGTADLAKSLGSLQSMNTTLESGLRHSLNQTFDVTTFGQNNYGFAVSGDLGHYGNKTVVIGKRTPGNVRYGLGYVKHSTTTDLLLNGTAKTTGNMYGGFIGYGQLDGTGLQAHLSLAVANGDAGIKRAYMAGAVADVSQGTADYTQRGLDFSIGYGKYAGNNWLVTPYVGIVSTKTSFDGYTETGGSFPARFDSGSTRNTYGQFGIKGKMTCSSTIKLVADISRMQHLSGDDPVLSGQLVDAFAFNQPLAQTKSYNRYYLGMNITTSSAQGKNPSDISLGYTKFTGANFGSSNDVFSIKAQFGF